MDTVLKCIEVTKTFAQPESNEILEVLKGITVEIHKEKITSIMGKSGVGKSTLLHILGALDRTTSGSVLYNNIDISTKSDDELAYIRNKEFGFVFQFHHLLPEFTALENVMMPLLLTKMSITSAKEKAKAYLTRVGLGDRLHHRPGKLSGGEKQRVAIARAIVNEPKIIFADEPTGNLDIHTSEEIHNLIWELNKENKQTFIIVTHNMELAAKADFILKIVDGKIVDNKD